MDSVAWGEFHQPANIRGRRKFAALFSLEKRHVRIDELKRLPLAR